MSVHADKLLALLPTLAAYFEVGGRGPFNLPNKTFIAFYLSRDLDVAGMPLRASSAYSFDDSLQLYVAMLTEEGRVERDNVLFQFLSMPVSVAGVSITLWHVIRRVLEVYGEELPGDVRAAWEAFLADVFLADAESVSRSLLRRGLPEKMRLESLKSILPSRGIKPNNKLANEITRDFIDSGEVGLVVSNPRASKEIVTRAMLSYTGENMSLLGSGQVRFTPYDREVHDGVVSLYVAGNTVITPNMVYRAMNGMTGTEFVSPQAVGAVTRSLDKSRGITVRIDFSQEARAYNKGGSAYYEGNLLACNKIHVSVSGKTQEAYRLLGKPILYEYAQMSGQIINVPISLLYTKGAVRSTDEVIVIRGYLLRQIEGMKSDSFKRNNHIRFDGVYAELDIAKEADSEANTKTQGAAYRIKTKKIRDHVDSILADWVEQGYIKGFEQYKEGTAIKGIVIQLHSE